MSMFAGPEDHAANPPETWQVVKIADRAWSIQTKDGTALHHNHPTRKAAAAQVAPGSWLRNTYDLDARWYAGQTPTGWRSWAECKAERERIEARQAVAAARRAVDAAHDALARATVAEAGPLAGALGEATEVYGRVLVAFEKNQAAAAK